jgi:hypothetical protein
MIRLEQLASLTNQEQALLCHMVYEKEPKRFWLHFKLLASWKKHKLAEKLAEFHDRLTEEGVPIYLSICKKLGFEVAPISKIQSKRLLTN